MGWVFAWILNKWSSFLLGRIYKIWMKVSRKVQKHVQQPSREQNRYQKQSMTRHSGTFATKSIQRKKNCKKRTRVVELSNFITYPRTSKWSKSTKLYLPEYWLFFLFIEETICRWYSVEVRRFKWVPITYVFLREIWKKSIYLII